MSAKPPPQNLWQAFDSLRPSEILRADLFIGLGVGFLGAWTASIDREAFDGALSMAAEMVGVVVGTVIAGTAVIAAFLSSTFLRKLQLINREPVRYLTPFLFTAALGVAAMFAVLGAGAIPASAPEWLFVVLAFVASWLVAWTLASLVPDLNTLVQFVRLQEAAGAVPDDEVADIRARASGSK
jgi:hypothetical protein